MINGSCTQQHRGSQDNVSRCDVPLRQHHKVWLSKQTANYSMQERLRYNCENSHDELTQQDPGGEACIEQICSTSCSSIA